MNRFVSLLVLIPLLVSLPVSPLPAPVPWQAKVDAQLLESDAQGQTEFLVYLRQQADLSSAARLKTKLEKGRFVYRQLTLTAGRTQEPILAALAAQKAENTGSLEYRSFWVANMIWVRGKLDVVEMLARRSEVDHIYANPSMHAIEPASDLRLLGPAAPGIEWNILKVRAPEVWAAGYRGQGVVIGGQDTGYDWDHPALQGKYRGWDGSTADHNYNWHDAIHENDSHTGAGNPCGFNASAPCDDYGHGTHTMGIMVGDDGTNQVGMAPSAKWVGCRNMEQGWGTPASYSECYEWFIAPTNLSGGDARPDLAPDVINNSWACLTTEGCPTNNPDILKTVVENVRAAGIVTVHSAGNEGSSCSSINTPSAIYDASFTVGNTTSADLIAGGSSRGPVTIDGSGRLKPDVSAPGTSIYSSVPGTGYNYMSGTSMAAPHVAGLVALLISAKPSLAGNVDEIENLITQHALPIADNTCGGPGGAAPNNVYGWGRIDAWESYSPLQHHFEIDGQASANYVIPGDILTYTLQITYQHPVTATITHNVVLTDLLPADTDFITATLPYTRTGSLLEWNFGELLPGESRTVQIVVQVHLDAVGVLTNQDYVVHSQEVPAFQGLPIHVLVVNGSFLYCPLLFLP